jgi:hypothetical protein
LRLRGGREEGSGEQRRCGADGEAPADRSQRHDVSESSFAGDYPTALQICNCKLLAISLREMVPYVNLVANELQLMRGQR